MKHIFVVNPKSGDTRDAGTFIKNVSEYFENKKDDFKIEFTEFTGHATKIAEKYINDDVRIYSTGGDGTLNEIVNGIIGTSIPIGVIPSGSGNDFIKSLDYPKKPNFDDLVFGKTKLIDAAKINDRYFINIASIGIDAEINKIASEIKSVYVPNKFKYIAAIGKSVFKYKSKKVKIIFENEEIYEDVTMITFCNGKFYGGGIGINSDGKIDDGKLEFYYVTKASAFKIIRALPSLARKKHLELDFVNRFIGEEIRIESKEDLIINVDGESIKDNNIKVEIVKKGINFIFPLER